MRTTPVFFFSRNGNRSVLLAALLALVVPACSSVRHPPAVPEPRSHYISGVPFYHLVRGQGSSCGPAALAGVVSFWNRAISMEQLVARVYLPELHGSLPAEMEQFLADSGLAASSSAGTVNEMKMQILRNVPVISLLDLGSGTDRKPRYVTVIGFDDAKGVFIVHDGLAANKTIEYGVFLRAWERAGNWMLVAVPGIQVKR